MAATGFHGNNPDWWTVGRFVYAIVNASGNCKKMRRPDFLGELEPGHQKFSTIQALRSIVCFAIARYCPFGDARAHVPSPLTSHNGWTRPFKSTRSSAA